MQSEAKQAYHRACYERNREKIKAQSKAHRSRTKSARQAYYAANREQLNEQRRAWRIVNAHKVRARAALWRKKNKAKIRDYQLQASYGLTSAQWESVFEKQSRRCAICSATEPTRTGRRAALWSTDHDHTTGAIRGILCVACNLFLGYGQDDPSLFQKAVHYLTRTTKL